MKPYLVRTMRVVDMAEVAECLASASKTQVQYPGLRKLRVPEKDSQCGKTLAPQSRDIVCTQ